MKKFSSHDRLCYCENKNKNRQYLLLLCSLLKRVLIPPQSILQLSDPLYKTTSKSGVREMEANTCYRRQARENSRDQDVIGFGVASDWSNKWREFFF